MPKGESYISYEAITVAGTAIPLTTIPAGARYARIFVETAPIRFRVDGTAPTATQGELVEAGSVIILDSRDQIQKLQVIRRGTTSATIRVHYAS